MARNGHENIMNDATDWYETPAPVVHDTQWKIQEPVNHPARLTNQTKIPISGQTISAFSATC